MLRTIENKLILPPKFAGLADPVLRVSLSLIFIIGGFGHFFAHDHMLSRMEQSPWKSVVGQIGEPSVLLWASGAVFIAAGATLALGWMTRLSALALFITLVPITAAVHLAPGHTGPLFKNIAILGALFFVFVRGAGRYAIDSSEETKR